MTGSVKVEGVKAAEYQRGSKDTWDWPPRFWKIQFEMEDGTRLSFNDGRRFARVRFLKDPTNVPPISKLGECSDQRLHLRTGSASMLCIGKLGEMVVHWRGLCDVGIIKDARLSISMTNECLGCSTAPWVVKYGACHQQAFLVRFMSVVAGRSCPVYFYRIQFPGAARQAFDQASAWVTSQHTRQRVQSDLSIQIGRSCHTRGQSDMAWGCVGTRKRQSQSPGVPVQRPSPGRP